MSELLFQAFVGIGIAIGAGFTGWQSWRARREAGRAASQTEATSNGFAADVLTRLQRIEKNGQATHDLADTTHRLMVSHLEAHTNSDLKHN